MAASDRLCIDACLYITHVMPDEDSAAVSALLREWRQAGASIVAPTLFRCECLNALRRAAIADRLSAETADIIREQILTFPVQLVALEDRAEEIWLRFVVELELPTVYDSLYLAVADDLGCELWTEDHRLYRAVHDHLPWVRCPSLETRAGGSPPQ